MDTVKTGAVEAAKVKNDAVKTGAVKTDAVMADAAKFDAAETDAVETAIIVKAKKPSFDGGRPRVRTRRRRGPVRAHPPRLESRPVSHGSGDESGGRHGARFFLNPLAVPA